MFLQRLLPSADQVPQPSAAIDLQDLLLLRRVGDEEDDEEQESDDGSGDDRGMPGPALRLEKGSGRACRRWGHRDSRDIVPPIETEAAA